MTWYHPLSADQNDYYRRQSGGLVLLDYGCLLNRVSRDSYGGRRNMTETPHAQRLLKEIKEAQEKLVFFFEVENKSAVLKKYICQKSQNTRLSLPLSSIYAYVAQELVYGGNTLVLVSTVARVCSAVDPSSSILEYRRLINTLVLENEGVFRVADEPDGEGENLHIGFGRQSPFLVDLFGKQAIPFLTPDVMTELRKQKQCKGNSKQKPSANNSPVPILSAKQIETRLQEYVVGQEEVVRSISVRLSLHLQKARMILAGENVTAPNEVILLIGSPSSGKSFIANCIPKVLCRDGKKIPFMSVSAADVTETGYVGLDIEVIPRSLISDAAGDLKLARTGIAFVDELCKRASKSPAHTTGTDISSGTQYGLLKLVEGSEMIIGEKRYSRQSSHGFTSFGLCFIFAGAFEGLGDILKRRNRKAGGMGFGEVGTNGQTNHLLSEALIDYGLHRQLVSRFTAILRLQDPTVEELVRIVSYPKGILCAYNEILKQSNLTVSLDEDAKLQLAEYAHETRTFARGMKRVVSRLVEDVVYAEVQGEVKITPADVRAVIDEPDHATPSVQQREPKGDETGDDAQPVSIYAS